MNIRTQRHFPWLNRSPNKQINTPLRLTTYPELRITTEQSFIVLTMDLSEHVLC